LLPQRHACDVDARFIAPKNLAALALLSQWDFVTESERKQHRNVPLAITMATNPICLHIAGFETCKLSAVFVRVCTVFRNEQKQRHFVRRRYGALLIVCSRH
jgi:hypothetical protein